MKNISGKNVYPSVSIKYLDISIKLKTINGKTFAPFLYPVTLKKISTVQQTLDIYLGQFSITFNQDKRYSWYLSSVYVIS